MSLDLGLVARLLAWRQGRAVRVASHCRVAISAEARILCPLQLSGEDATLHGFALGKAEGPPEILWVPDPRLRDDQHALFAQLGDRLGPWMRESVAAGVLPQLWLPSGAALSLLDLLEERLRGQKEGEPGFLLHASLAMFLRQSHLEGSQALEVATEALSAHWATGQQPGEDAHLGSLLAWIDPPMGVALTDALVAAERVPMGVKTRPELDRDVLVPAVGAWNRARRTNDADGLARHAAAVELALRETLAPIFAATQRAIAQLRREALPALPMLDALVARDLGYFNAIFNPPEPEEGEEPKKRAHPIGHQAIALVTAEDALEQHAAALVHGDAVALAEARSRGNAVAARIAGVDIEKRGKKTFCHLELVSSQAISRLRPGDAVSLLGAPHFAFKVASVRGEGGQTLIRLRMEGGVRRARELVEGTRCDLVPPPPNLGQVGGTIKRMQLRLAELPWTHTEQLPAAHPHGAAPDDPLADVENLR